MERNRAYIPNSPVDVVLLKHWDTKWEAFVKKFREVLSFTGVSLCSFLHFLISFLIESKVNMTWDPLNLQVYYSFGPTSPSVIAASLSVWLIRPSCFLCRFSANWRMLSRIYWLGCNHWLSRVLITTWLSEPKIVGWVNLELRLLNRWPITFYLTSSGMTVSFHVTCSSTSPTYSLMLLHIPPITLLRIFSMTLASLQSTPLTLYV